MNPRNQEIAKIFAGHHVQAAYLFGSRKSEGLAFLAGAKNLPQPDPTSDLDIGILLSHPPTSLFTLHGDLYAALSDLFRPFDIDIVFLHEVDALLQFDIISGHRIFTHDEESTDEYEEYIMKKASDLYQINKRMQHDFYEGIADGYREIK
ncbi:MAG: nucleotidyltransferase domain-containing protein [Acidobacteria bacterium]|nr:nucleotidyltransferase domain-containing protein [Acidobacteriota bacterium]MBU1473355.1 nucleotidyltransferase domain-containing protein [Acidobacteriota bacterium]MBU4202823.1 nucleotidyltransferase domain-containing protein [Acidobacteriota bacterium]MCG2816135.1 nucleotidyltransferase domain-containing protein [Candidatus Aminicenantes bacterium]